MMISMLLESFKSAFNWPNILLKAVFKSGTLGLFVFVFVFVFISPCFDACALEGKIKRSAEIEISKKKKAKTLEGGIKDEAELKPSVKVLPGSAKKSSNEEPTYDGNVEQYAGGHKYSSGGPVSVRPSFFPQDRRGHRISPVTDYVLTPRNGIMTFGGHGVVISPSRQEVRTNRQGYGLSVPHSNKGITTFVPGYESRLNSSQSKESYEIHPVTIRGVTGWSREIAPARSIGSINRVDSRSGVTSWAPGFAVEHSSSHGHDFVFSPGASIAKVASVKGVTAWSSGYQVTVNTAGGYKKSLGGMWYDPVKQDELAAKPAGLLPAPVFAQPVLEGPLMAKADLLPQLRNSAFNQNITWKDWYSTVAGAIYSRWKNADVGPGKAKVQVVITKEREISCQVLDFFPAPFVDRDIDKETEFRVAAVRAVDSVQRYEIPAFPPLADCNSVKFEVVLKRTVDGPIGIDLTKL